MAWVPIHEIAHEAVADVVAEGDFVIDCTAGNGHDTAFLCDRVGAGGRVLAIDIQQAALDSTRVKLEDLGLDGRAELVLGDHAQLDELLSQHAEVTQPTAVMFNLGYLPGGDKTVVTSAETTAAALEASIGCLATGGILTVVVYRGHGSAASEAQAVETWLDDLPSRHAGVSISRHGFDSTGGRNPYLAIIRKPRIEHMFDFDDRSRR